MPRGAWLALGASGAALLASLAATGPLALPVALAGLAMTPVAAVLALRRRSREAALIAGIASIGLRLALGGMTAPVSVPPPTAALRRRLDRAGPHARLDRWWQAARRPGRLCTCR